MKKTGQNKQFLKLSGAVLGAGLIIFALSFILSKPQKNDNNSVPTISPAIPYAEKIDGLAADTKINVQYLTKEDSLSVETIAVKSAPVILSNSKIKKITDHNHYNVSYILTLPDDEYIDIAINIDKDKNNLKASLSGLKRDDKVSLTINNQAYHAATPVDWAGKIELTSGIIAAQRKNNICLQINNAISLCHLSSSGRQATS